MLYTPGMPWPTQWTSKNKPTFPVVCVTTRDETGIDYEVRVSESGVAAYEEGDGEIVVWTTRREFGQRSETMAGGAAFQWAARQQEEVAEQWVKAITAGHG